MPTTNPPAQGVPATLAVSYDNRNGVVCMSIAVAADDGRLISGFTGMLQDGSEFQPFTTGASGTAIYRTVITERSRYFEVRAGNKPELVWQARLVGREPVEIEYVLYG